MKPYETVGWLLIVACGVTCAATDSTAARWVGIAAGVFGLYLLGLNYRRRRPGVSARGNYDLHTYHAHGGDDAGAGGHGGTP